jgi:hypothetical protein
MYPNPFFSKLMHTINSGKSSSKIRSTFVIFKETAQSKQQPKGQKFAQSGHPAFVKDAA